MSGKKREIPISKLMEGLKKAQSKEEIEYFENEIYCRQLIKMHPGRKLTDEELKKEK
jgi:hypothetical protein